MMFEDMDAMYAGKRRFDAPFHFRDAMWDSFKTGKGPFAPMLGFGLIYRAYEANKKRTELLRCMYDVLCTSTMYDVIVHY